MRTRRRSRRIGDGVPSWGARGRRFGDGCAQGSVGAFGKLEARGNSLLLPPYRLALPAVTGQAPDLWTATGAVWQGNVCLSGPGRSRRRPFSLSDAEDLAQEGISVAAVRSPPSGVAPVDRSISSGGIGTAACTINAVDENILSRAKRSHMSGIPIAIAGGAPSAAPTG